MRIHSSRRLLGSALFAALLLTSGCRGKHGRTEVKNEEPAAPSATLASSFKMADPAASQQLPKGFYAVESNAWRWTAGAFSVVLRPPIAAAQRGGTLTFALSVPDVVITKNKAVTLTAAIGSTKLKSETYSKPGAYTFTADVPVELLSRDSVTVDFSLDKFIAAGAIERRELGVVANAVGLESK